MTNPTSSMMRLEKLETLDASRHDSLIDTERGSRIIATLAGTDLDGTTKPLVPATTLTLAPPQVTRLFLDATFTRGARIPRRLEHRFTFILTPPAGPRSVQSHRTATLPVNGAFHAPERFAIDFIQLGADRKLLHGPVPDLHSYRYFGSKVLSVADGRVVGLQDGLPEQTPPSFPPTQPRKLPAVTIS